MENIYKKKLCSQEHHVLHIKSLIDSKEKIRKEKKKKKQKKNQKNNLKIDKIVLKYTHVQVLYRKFRYLAKIQ